MKEKIKSLEKVLAESEVKELIKRIGPHIDSRYDYTYAPTYVKGRSDVCAVKRMAEDGSSYGFDTVYLVWKDKKGTIRHHKLIDSRYTKDYIHIDELVEDKEQIKIKVRSGGSYSGQAWEKDFKISKKELGVK